MKTQKMSLLGCTASLTVVVCLVSTGSAATLSHFRFEETPLGVHNSWSNSEGPGPAGTSKPIGTVSNTADVFGPVVPESGAANGSDAGNAVEVYSPPSMLPVFPTVDSPAEQHSGSGAVADWAQVRRLSKPPKPYLLSPSAP